MDALGVNQHHDAITGTAKQHVADDYRSMIFKATDASDVEYEAEVKKITEAATGLNIDAFQRCTVQNGTYTDCPISNFEYESDEFLVSVHNPASIENRFPRIQVPLDDYKTYIYNSWIRDFVEIDSDRFCYEHMHNNRSVDIACDLFLNSTIPATQFAFFKIVKLNSYNYNH